MTCDKLTVSSVDRCDVVCYSAEPELTMVMNSYIDMCKLTSSHPSPTNDHCKFAYLLKYRGFEMRNGLSRLKLNEFFTLGDNTRGIRGHSRKLVKFRCTRDCCKYFFQIE